MDNLPAIIKDLALILVLAGFVTVLFRILKQPVILGYIMAGILVGPHFPFTPRVVDYSSVQVWAEIGMIFLLFSLGLEFSFKKLARVGGNASLTAAVEIVFMLGMGYIAGQFFGWGKMDSLFLGGIICVSSTTIIMRAFNELGFKSRKFVGLVSGVLVVEDVAAIILLVLLSTLAVGQNFYGSEVVFPLIKMIFFLTTWFVIGIFLIPNFLRQLRNYLPDETLLIVSVGLCLMMVVLASTVGLSPALGAFIMGSILAESAEAPKIEALIKPVGSLFGAVFFVSVGMLINPTLLANYAFPVIAIILLTIFGKVISTTAGALLSGQTLKPSLQTGMSMAQIGEFSFIMATLGLTLSVTSEFLYPVAVVVSAVTTFTTPYMIKYSENCADFLERKLPTKWVSAINEYAANTQRASIIDEWKDIVHNNFTKLFLNAVVVIFIVLLVSRLLYPMVTARLGEGQLVTWSMLLGVLMLCSPFLWAMSTDHKNKNRNSEFWVKNIIEGPFVVIQVVRMVIILLLIAFISAQFVPLTDVLWITIALFACFALFFSTYLELIYKRIEGRFLRNLSEREEVEKNKELMKKRQKKIKGPIVPWDAHIANIEVPRHSSFVGKTLENLKVRELFGVTIAVIERGEKKVVAPKRDEIIFPFDVIAVIGNDSQIEAFQKAITQHPEENLSEEELKSVGAEYALEQVFIGDDSPFVGKTIRDSGMRETLNALVVGVEREGRRILNPDSGVVFKDGDIAWVVGDVEKIRNLKAVPIAE
jgi:CPA2 family monovalent cation:H+ antiporter-2